MKQLIAATITSEAAEVWNSWPKKSAEFDYPGRSACLSKLLVESGSMPGHIEALKLREGSLLGSLAITRESLVSFLRLTPPLKRPGEKNCAFKSTIFKIIHMERYISIMVYLMSS